MLNLKELEAIVFDFDGVLVDSEIIVSRAFRQYLSNLNIIITEKEFANFAGNRTIDVISKLSNRFSIQDKQKFYNKIFTIIVGIRCDPGIIAIWCLVKFDIYFLLRHRFITCSISNRF